MLFICSTVSILSRHTYHIQLIQLDRVQSQDLEVKRIIYTASIYKYKDYMVVAINIYLHIKHRFCNYL